MATAATAIVKLVPEGTASVQGAFNAIGAKAQELGRQGSTALRTVAQSAASVADAGKISAGSLATMLGQLGDLAVGFGAAGPLVGALAVGAGAITKYFLNARDEMKKTREAFEDEVAQMLNAADYESLAKKAREIQFGTAAHPEAGLDALKAQRAKLEQYIRDHPLDIFGIGSAQHQIDELDKKIRPLQDEFDKVTKALTTPQITAHQGGLAQGVTIMAQSAADAAKKVIAAQAEQVTAFADLAKQGRLTGKDLADAEALETKLARAMMTGTAAIRAQTGALLDQLHAAIGSFGATGPRVNPLTAAFGGPMTEDEVNAQTDAALAKQSKALNTRIHATAEKAITPAQEAAAMLHETLADQFAQGISGGIVDGIDQGFAAAFQKGSIGAGFKALGAGLVSGLGSAMVQFGKASLAASSLMAKIKSGLQSFLPGGAITAALAMIALGEAFRAVAGSAQSSFGGSFSDLGGVAAVGGSGIADVVRATQTTSIVGAGSAGTSMPLTPMRMVHIGQITVLSPHDPSFQTDIATAVQGAVGRGLL